MLPLVNSILAYDSEVAGFVGDRIYRAAAPQGTPRPYIVWHVIDAVPENTLDRGGALIDGCRIQVGAWSDRSAQAEAIAAAARRAIETDHDILSYSGPTQDPQTLAYWVTIDFTFWNPA